MGDPSQVDRELAARFGAHASFQTDAAPASMVYSAGNPAEDLAGLLDQHVDAETRFFDIGCGAGQTIHRLAPRVCEAWGFDQDAALLNAARDRAAELGIGNATFVEGNVAEDADIAQLPDGYFDLALSQRGPNLNAAMLTKLRPDAIFIQEFVAEFDWYPLNEALGRRAATCYSATGHEQLVRHYLNLGLFPVGTREYFHEAYFRDSDHLAKYLGELGPARWPQDSDEIQDRSVLTAYAGEHTTALGVRLLHHRRIFVLQRAKPSYFPPIAP
jgi:SAM-dependent methyltransferase